MAHLKTKATTGKLPQREQWKWKLIRGLYEKEFEREQIIKLFEIIDNMMTLSPELQSSLESKIKQFEEERTMPLMSNMELRGRKIGEEIGELRGIERGREIGKEIGLEQGKEIGMEQGNALLFAVLCASASYIAVPAAMRLAVPQANMSLLLPMALGLTFSLNITLGIPLYYAVIERLWG